MIIKFIIYLKGKPFNSTVVNCFSLSDLMNNVKFAIDQRYEIVRVEAA